MMAAIDQKNPRSRGKARKAIIRALPTHTLPSEPPNSSSGSDAGGGEASLSASTIDVLPHPENSPQGGEKARLELQPTKKMPSRKSGRKARADHLCLDAQMAHVSASTPGSPGGEDRANVSELSIALMPDLSNIIATIGELQVRRVATIKAQIRIDNANRALVGRYLGFRIDLPEAERAKINKRAVKLIAVIEGGTEPAEEDMAAAASLAPFVLAAQAGRLPFDALRKECEKEMERLGKLLPVWPWVESVKGFGAKGLAIIVGECGDLSNYANPAKLWKRMGLAVMGGNRQGNPGKGATADDWISHGYSPRRRSALWTLGDSLLKGNGDGEYRAAYLARKEYELARNPEMSKMHAHRRAQRYVEKRLLRDLWRAWRDATISCVSTALPLSHPAEGEVT